MISDGVLKIPKGLIVNRAERELFSSVLMAANFGSGVHGVFWVGQGTARACRLEKQRSGWYLPEPSNTSAAFQWHDSRHEDEDGRSHDRAQTRKESALCAYEHNETITCV